MEVKELAKEWRIWVLLVALVGATLMLNPGYGQENGEVVINTNLEDRMGIDFTGGTRLLLDMQTNETDLNQTEVADQVRNTLDVRLRQSGIADPSIRTVDIGGGEKRIQIEVAVTNQTRISELIQQEGSFEARMPIRVMDSKEFTLDETYTFTRNGENISVADETYRPGDEFELDDAQFYYINQSDDVARLEVVTYTGEDIEDVLTGDPNAGVGTSGPPYSWQFPIVINTESAENVNRIAQNYQTSISSGSGSWLIHENGEFARMGLYVDGNKQTGLRMSSVFQQQILTQSQISGGGETREAARKDMDEMAAILQSGSLPVPVNVESISTLSSALGDEFLQASILSIIGSLIAVGALVTIRYQNPKIALPIVVTGAAEVYIMLGFWFTTLGTLSLSAIAGIIAAVGTGVDDQIIITDESDRESIESRIEKMKRAFFVIFTSAASTIGAMLPIIYPGLMSMLVAASGVGLLLYNFYSRGSNSHFTAIGVMAAFIGAFLFSMGPSGAAMSTIHDFAWTTILGIMVGITITRPAFAKILEQIEK